MSELSGQQQEQQTQEGEEGKVKAEKGMQQNREDAGVGHVKWLCHSLRLFAGGKQHEEELRKLQLRQVGLQQQQKQLQAAKDQLDLKIQRR